MLNKKPANINEYIEQIPANTKVKLQELRKHLKECVPEAQEQLKWGKPAFVTDMILFIYAGFNHHISFHPTPSVIKAYKKELSEFKISSNTVQFPIDKKPPLALIKDMVDLRVKESNQGVNWK